MLYQILSGNFNIVSVLMGILATTIIIMVILPFHELAHGFVAYKLGDDTAKRQGRLTFNPLAHINYMGAVCLLLVGFGWAEPVPVNYYRLKN
ncbi:MAG: site-2 protease family protein, partial [Clostridia bacterium]|nr:site-2 protease family protein [Clostridia bacterium]